MFGIIANALFILFIAFVATCNSQRRNILFILADDFRPAIGKYGDSIAITPNIDRFISRSSYFTRAYSQQALCAPSRNSLLTGRRPDTLHLYDFYSYWRTAAGNFTTLPQYFKKNGYHTYSIGKVFHPGISSNFSDDYPFSWSSPSFHPSTERYMNSNVCSDGSGTLRANLICPVKVHSQPEQTLPDIESLQEAKRFLQERAHRADPFFLAVGFHKPHIPFRFPDKYLRLYEDVDFGNTSEFRTYGIPDVAWNPYNDIRERYDAKQMNISFPYGPIPTKFAALIKLAYYSSVSYVDNLFGQLISAIDMTNTIIVFTSDHGWSLGEHGEWAKYSNFDISVRVPLVFYVPDTVPRRIDNVVELIDVFPTLVELSNRKALPTCVRPHEEMLCTEGKSLVPLIHGHFSGWNDEALSQYPRPGRIPTSWPNSDQPRLRQIRIMGYSMRTQDFRYTLWIRFFHKSFRKDWNTTYGEELYDHRFDSAERINLYDHPDLKNVVYQLRSMLVRRFS